MIWSNRINNNQNDDDMEMMMMIMREVHIYFKFFLLKTKFIIYYLIARKRSMDKEI